MGFGRKVVGVKMDDQGMIPDELETILKSFNFLKVRMIYLCPHGQNPGGGTFSVERKVKIYGIARKHDLTIVEDDPYFFCNLQLGDPLQSTCDRLEAKEMPGTERFPKSFLSLDTDGRVVRLDSLSKMICPGFRFGWATMHPALFQKWLALAEVTTWSVSGFQQHTFLNMMTELGDQGLHEHLQKLQSTYARRRNFLVKACQKHLEGLCRWNVPEFGMFLWMEVLGVEDTASIIDDLITSYNIAMVPGGAFNASGDENAPCSYFRVSFSQLTEEKADKAMGSLREALLNRKTKS